MSSGFNPDIIVGIAYGGIIPTTLLYFALPETRYEIAYLKSDRDHLVEPLHGFEEQKVLLVDDLVITGDSLSDIKSHILGLGAETVVTACLFRSMDYRGLDHSVRVIEHGERVVFPWYSCEESGSFKVFKFKNRFGKHEPMGE